MTPGDERQKKAHYLSDPVLQLKMEKGMGIGELLDNFGGMSIQARNLGQAARIWSRMLNDEDRPTIFMGISGPLIAAGLREVIADLIRGNLVDVIVSTGAIVYQDLIYARGGRHCMGYPEVDDTELRELGINRIYNVFSDDDFFLETDQYIADFTDGLEPGNYSSREFLTELAKEVDDERSILKASLDTGTPIFVPALNDSSIGIGLTVHWTRNKDKGKVSIDSIKDNYEIVQTIKQSKCTSAVYIGGGVPKNFVNDAIVMANVDFESNIEGHRYAIQLSTALTRDGGLSGSTLEEAMAWGKIKGDARTAMVFQEVSIGLPLLTGYLLDKGLWQKRPEKEFKF